MFHYKHYNRLIVLIRVNKKFPVLQGPMNHISWNMTFLNKSGVYVYEMFFNYSIIVALALWFLYLKLLFLIPSIRNLFLQTMYTFEDIAPYESKHAEMHHFRGQFNQHFTFTFFVQKQISLATFSLLIFWCQIFESVKRW